MKYLILLVPLILLACTLTSALPATPPGAPILSPTPTTDSVAVVGQGAAVRLPERTCARVIAAQALHIRLDADFESAVVGYLYHDQVVTVFDDSNPDWWIVSDGSQYGYARSAYLAATICPDPEN